MRRGTDRQTDLTRNVMMSTHNVQQGNCRLHFARAVHSRHPFPADPIFSERSRDRMIPFAASELQCQWGRKPLPGDRRCGLSSSCRRRTEPRTYATCTKIGKDRACDSGYILSDRQTDALITILLNRSRGRSKTKHRCRFQSCIKNIQRRARCQVASNTEMQNGKRCYAKLTRRQCNSILACISDAGE